MSPRTPQHSHADIRMAIWSLTKDHKIPSVRSVRAALGGGSTAIISQVLKNEVELNEQAQYLSEEITAYELFSVIVSEGVSDAYVRARQYAEENLSGWVGQHYPPKESSFRDYVAEGISVLDCMSICALDEIKNIQFSGDHCQDDVSERDIERIQWLRAYALAADAADRAEIAIRLGEDWLDLNDIEQEIEE